jgi:hypothetical protein
MGLHRHSIAFLAAAHAAGVSFDRTLMLGRQSIFAGTEQLVVKAFSDAGQVLDASEARRILAAEQRYAEPLFRHLGARLVDSIDASEYERCTIVHDLNEPLPEALRASYSAVVDGGTLEHVFNFPTALRSALEAVSLGGHYIAFTPADNHFGHGFYQFSPELHYRVLSPDNGFRVRCVLMHGYNAGARWYRVADPDEVRHRVVAHSFWPMELHVLAQRVELKDVLATFPQQSDYVDVWRRGEADIARRAVRRLRTRLGEREPLAVKSLRLTLGSSLLRRTRGDFEAISIADLPSVL